MEFIPLLIYISVGEAGFRLICQNRLRKAKKEIFSMERLKKIFVGGVMLVTVLSMSVVVAPNVGATASAGDLIKMNGLSSVYYLGGDGKRYVFPNEQTYFSWYSDFSGVVTISQSELESYPLGANVTLRPGTKLAKITTNPKVYAVTSGGNLVAVPDEATASTLYGANWAKRVVDVPDAFFTNYKISSGTVSASAYPAGSLVKWADAADVYFVNADGSISKVATEAAFTANRFQWSNVLSAPTSVAKPTAAAEISGVSATLTDTSSGAGGSAGAGTGLTVALASSTAAAATVITNSADTTNGNGQAMVPFVTVNFTASSDGDVKVTNLKFKRTGISADADLDGLFLYDGATRLTDSSSISSNYTTFNNASGLFTIAKGTTKAITLKGDMNYAATSGKTIGFSINAATDVTTNGAAVSGSFPVSGNLMSIANATDLGLLTFAGYTNYPTTDPTSINAVNNQELFRFNLQSTNQELKVERIKLTAVGSLQTTDIKNLTLFYSGTQVGSTVASLESGNVADFDLSASPLTIAKGSSKTISLRGDIVSGSTRTFYFSFQNQNDIVVKDTSYNVYVEPYKIGTFAVIKPSGSYTIASGSLSIVRATDSPTADVAVDANNVPLAIFDFTASGEDIKVKDLNVQADISGGTNGGVLNGKVYLDDVQVGTTKNLTEATPVSFTFGSTFVVKSGTTAKVKIVGDMKTTTSTSYNGTEKVTITLTAGSGNAQRMVSLGTFNAPATGSSVPGNQLTVTSAGLSIAKYSGYGNQTVVSGTNNAKLGSFVISAGAAEGVSVNSITVALSEDEDATVTNMYMKDHATGAQLGSTIVSPTTANVYTVSFNLAASGSKVIDLYGNVKASSNVGPWIANIAADGSGVTTSKSTSATAVDIQTMTIAGSGGITSTGGSQPDSAILLAGSTGNSVAQFTFNATNEGFTIDKLNFKTGNNFSTSTAGITIKYNNKAGVEQTATSVFDTATQIATFTGLSLYVPANGDASVNVYIDLTSIASGAVSGAYSAISLDQDTGFNATGESGTVKTSSGTGDLAANNFWVRKSKPTFSRQTVSGAPSSSNALYKFTVVADAAGNIDIKQLGFTFVTSGCDVTNVYLYDSNTSTKLTDTEVVPTWNGSGGDVKLLVGDIDTDVLTIGTTAKTYEVRGTVTGYSSSAGDSITVQFKQDTSSALNDTAYAIGADGAANASNKYNVWSDKSVTGQAHTTGTTDWTNGYLIKNMTEAQSF